MEIYYRSVGRNANLLLNVPVDRRGLIHANDSMRLMDFKKMREAVFTNDLAMGSEVSASNVRGKSHKFSATNLTDGNADTYWTTDDNVTYASVTINLGKPVRFNRLVLGEYIALGQRVQSFKVEYFDGDRYRELDRQTTIGYKRILTFPLVKSSQLRITFLQAKASPLITAIQIYNAPGTDEPILNDD